MSIYASKVTRPPLDSSLYDLAPEESAFFKTLTAIDNDEDLKAHILAVQAKAYDVYGYPCIRGFSFTKLKISRLPAYAHVLKLGREREGAIFLDIGCCFGNDARKVVIDGYPMQNVIASDLRPEFWELGHELFRSSPETFPVPFIPGDVFDENFLMAAPPLYDVTSSIPPLSSLISLTPLYGHISVIHASSFFHLFNEEKQTQVARSLASLLSPLPGSLMLGVHLGQPEPGSKMGQRGNLMFHHSPHSWRDLWDGKVFTEGTVKVEARLKEVQDRSPFASPNQKAHLLVWSVTRM